MKTEVPPRLSDVAQVIVHELVGSSLEVALSYHNSQLRRILESLFNHYFSTHLPIHNAKDIQWFLETANKNTHWNMDAIIQQVKENDISAPPLSEEHESQGCIPMSVYHYYLTLMLGKADISNVGTVAMTTLTLYKPWVSIFCVCIADVMYSLKVREMVGTVLVSDGPPSSTPCSYIPTFYQCCSGINCPDGATVSI